MRGVFMYTNDVFGVSPEVKEASYVDRALLDSRIKKLLRRNKHVALNGSSKNGKSWLRQKCIVNANVVQCRLGKTINDIFREALGNIGVILEIEKTTEHNMSGKLSVNGEAGFKLLAKVMGSIEGEISGKEILSYSLKVDLNNLKLIADLLKESGKMLVIEDFHYLSIDERKKMAFDLKTLWDYECYVVIVGIWTQTNLLTSLNPDLSGRIEEVSITWSDTDLEEVIKKGSEALNITVSDEIRESIVKDSFGNVGVLQSLMLYLVADVYEIEQSVAQQEGVYIDNKGKYNEAARMYADQLDGVYQQFAKSVSKGIRNRQDSTGIYAYSMKIIMEASDQELIEGLSRDKIYNEAHALESRIQKGNLKIILGKLEEIQVDSEYRGLVVGYDESTDSVFVVDRQLLFYRKYHTMQWPWEELAEETMESNNMQQ